MAEDKYTRCPGCATVFRVTDEQLAKRGGQVRCGHCKTVFDGAANRIELGIAPLAGTAPMATPPARTSVSTSAPTGATTVSMAAPTAAGTAPTAVRTDAGGEPPPVPPPSVAPQPSPAPPPTASPQPSPVPPPTASPQPSPVPPPTASPQRSPVPPPTASPPPSPAPQSWSAQQPPAANDVPEPESSELAPAMSATEALAAAAPITGGSSAAVAEAVPLPGTPTESRTSSLDGTPPDVAYEDRFAPVVRSRSRRARIAWYASATAFLLLLLALQAVLHFHDAIAAHWPVARPALDRLCSLSGCAIRPLRDSPMSYLSIESSDLQADPAHRGLLILNASVRNRAPWPLAYPYLELTLTDAQDRVVVRRALAPADYAAGTADLNAGIAPNAEVSLKVFIDASATTQAGYRLYMFYP